MNVHGSMYLYPSLPSENMSGHTIQANVVTTYPSINREAYYPPPSYPPMQPNHGISEESGIPLSEDSITGQKTRKQATKRRFMCKKCPNKSYAQQQGLNRHYGKKHNPNLCKCGKFEWIRPYEYRAHLEKYHPDENPDEVLGKPAKSRRRTAAFVGRRPQNDPPPIDGYDGSGQSHSEYRPYPPAVANFSTITPPQHCMIYVPQPESTQVNESSREEDEHKMTWIPPFGAPQVGYGSHLSNPGPVMPLTAAFTPIAGGYHVSQNFAPAPEGQT